MNEDVTEMESETKPERKPRIHVGNLPMGMTAPQLRAMMKHHGRMIGAFKLINRSYGFVEFEHVESVYSALLEDDRKNPHGVRISWATQGAHALIFIFVQDFMWNQAHGQVDRQKRAWNWANRARAALNIEDRRVEDRRAENRRAENRRVENHRAENRRVDSHQAENRRVESHQAEDHRLEDRDDELPSAAGAHNPDPPHVLLESVEEEIDSNVPQASVFTRTSNHDQVRTETFEQYYFLRALN